MIKYLVLFFALVFSTATVAADSRSEAKSHYQAGVKAYNAGDYKGAIREFSTAQELAPADLNNYNLALCYDKLGEPEPAIQHYRAFLDKQPGTDKKTEIEASIARLEKAAKSAAAKKAAREQEEEAKRLAEQKKLDEEAKKAEEARRAEEAKQPATDDTSSDIGGGKSLGIGSTGTPGGTGTVSTGDAQLDRVQRIDINAIRDQRLGGQSSGMIAPAPTGPSTTGATDATGNAAANIDINAQANGMQSAPPATASAGPTQPSANGSQLPEPNDKPKTTPVYKKWWFWAVVGVSLYVVISIAAEDDGDDTRARMMPMPMGTSSNSALGGAGGATLLRW